MSRSKVTKRLKLRNIILSVMGDLWRGCQLSAWKCGLSSVVIGVAMGTTAWGGTVTKLNGTSGSNVNSDTLSTTGDLDVQLGFYADYLVVGGGGGGGGYIGGGGGGGAVKTSIGSSPVELSSANHGVVVGQGGAGGVNASRGSTGGQSSVFGITAAGGGGGGSYYAIGDANNTVSGQQTGGSGASGGGGAPLNDSTTISGGTGVVGEGFSGGSGRNNGGWRAGGGGGAGGAGGNADASGGTVGNGGQGVSATITGDAVLYSGGGGGGSTAGGTAGTGGSSGVGANGVAGTGGVSGTTNGFSALNNRGGGGGGGGYFDGGSGAVPTTGGAGGSGVVTIRYEGASVGSIGGAVSGGVGSAAGYTLHTFTSPGASSFDMSGVDLNSRLGVTQDGVISGTGNLSFSGPGTLTLNAANTHSGTTRAVAGTLNLGNVNALQNSTLNMQTGDAGTVGLTLSGQTYNIGGLQGTRNLALGDNSISVGANNGSTTYSGVLSGTGGLTKVGSGTLTLNGANTYSGTTRVGTGTLVVSNDRALQSSTLDMNAADAGTVQFNGAFGQQFTIGGLEGTRNLAAGTFGLKIGANNASTSYSGVISGGFGLIKEGTGTLTLNGANTFLGQTRVSAGTLNLGNVNALQSSTLDMNAADAGTVGLTQSGQTYNIGGLQGTRSLALGDNTISVGSRNMANTYSGALSGTGGLTKVGTQTLTLSGANTYSGTTRVGAGTLALGNVNALSGSTLNMDAADTGTVGLTLSGQTYNVGGLEGTRNLALGNNSISVGANNGSTNYSGALSGTGGLTKVGTGTLALDGANTHSGTTRAVAGTLNLGNVNALQSSTLDMNAADAGTVGLTQSGQTYNIGGLQGTRNLALGDNTISVGANNGSTNYSGALSGTGGLTKVGTGTLALDGANTHSGTTRAVAGTLNLGNVNSLQSSTLDMNAADAGTVGLTQSGQTYNIAGLQGTRNLALGDNTISVGANNGSTSYSGALSGTGGLTKVGSGRMVLDGTSSYTGATNVNGGTLAINGDNSAATGAVSVATGSVLEGDGIVGGTTTILSGGMHSPGNSPALQTFANGLNYNTGSTFQWELIGNTADLAVRGIQYDGVDVSGNPLTIQSGVTSALVFNAAGSSVLWSDTFWGSNQSWKVFNSLAGMSLASAAIFDTITASNDSGGFSLNSVAGRESAFFNWSQVGSDLFLNYVNSNAAAVPEPSTIVVLGLAGVGLARRKLRRSRRASEATRTDAVGS